MKCSKHIMAFKDASFCKDRKMKGAVFLGHCDIETWVEDGAQCCDAPSQSLKLATEVFSAVRCSGNFIRRSHAWAIDTKVVRSFREGSRNNMEPQHNTRTPTNLRPAVRTTELRP